MLKRKNKNIFWIVFIGIILLGIYNTPSIMSRTGTPVGAEIPSTIQITILGPVQEGLSNIVTAIQEPIMESPLGGVVEQISNTTGILQNNIILTIIIIVTSLLVIYIINKKN